MGFHNFLNECALVEKADSSTTSFPSSSAAAASASDKNKIMRPEVDLQQKFKRILNPCINESSLIMFGWILMGFYRLLKASKCLLKASKGVVKASNGLQKAL